METLTKANGTTSRVQKKIPLDVSLAFFPGDRKTQLLAGRVHAKAAEKIAAKKKKEVDEARRAY